MRFLYLILILLVASCASGPRATWTEVVETRDAATGTVTLVQTYHGEIRTKVRAFKEADAESDQSMRVQYYDVDTGGLLWEVEMGALADVTGGDGAATFRVIPDAIDATTDLITELKTPWSGLVP